MVFSKGKFLLAWYSQLVRKVTKLYNKHTLKETPFIIAFFLREENPPFILVHLVIVLFLVR